MHNHVPNNYVCPFCLIATGGEDRHSQQADVVYHDESVTAFIAPKWWADNPANVLVVPNQHFENIYDISEDVLAKVYIVAKKVAEAMRDAYDCEGTSMRQHNEEAGGQDIWHFHVQVFARRMGDGLYQNYDNARFVEPQKRHVYAEKLRDALL